VKPDASAKTASAARRNLLAVLAIAIAFAVTPPASAADTPDKEAYCFLLDSVRLPDGLWSISWEQDGRTLRAITSLDMSLLGPAPSFETPSCWISLIHSISAPETPSAPKTLHLATASAATEPALASEAAPTELAGALRSPGIARFFIVEEPGAPVPDQSIAWLDALHAYVEANAPELAAARDARNAAEALAARQPAPQVRKAPRGTTAVKSVRIRRDLTLDGWKSERAAASGDSR
jgi:hypothetical protein